MFNLQDVKVYQNVKISRTLTIAKQRFELIYLLSVEFAYINKTRKNETIDLLHAKLGHVSYNKLKVMMNKSMLRGLLKLNVRINMVFVECQYGKAHQLSYEESMFRVKEPLKLVDSNVFGPINQPSISGIRYMVSFINDFSGYV